MSINSGVVSNGWNSYLITYNDCLIDFFERHKVYLQYPWKIKGVYKNGDKFRVPKKLFVEQYANMPRGRVISLGAFSYSRTTNMDVDFKCGRYCSVAPDVSLSDQEHPLDRVSTHPFSTHAHMVDFAEKEFGVNVFIEKHNFLLPPPEIGHDVWIGAGAQIKRGLKIGTGAVIAGRAVVTKDVPPYAIVGGVPAKVIRYRFNDNLIEKLIDSRWWEFKYTDFPAVSTRSIDCFIEGIQKLREENPEKIFDSESVDLVPELLGFIRDNMSRWGA